MSDVAEHRPLLQPGEGLDALAERDLRAPDEFEEAVAGCTRCPLADGRTQVVRAAGSHKARLLVLGDQPGRQEDVQGEAYVGASGNVLRAALADAGLGMDEVLMTTLVRCHPPEDRDAEPLELEACFPWLLESIAMGEPDVVITLGELPAAALLRRRIPIDRLIGHRLPALEGRATLVPTYDPDEAVRNNHRASAAIRRAFATARALLDGELPPATSLERAG